MNQILEHWWFPVLIVALCGVRVWRSARRLARLSASESKIRRVDTPELSTNAPFRRADFAAHAEIVRKERVKGTAIAGVIFVAWPALLFAISRLAPSVPHRSLVAFQA